MESSSSGSSSKRAKALASIGQVANCLVDGCTADLSLCRDYHRRHKVCEVHSKTPKVTIAGREQRFCQQCSRFHSLSEFDEGKRSCRKRLDGHNRRRRKPQPPEPLPLPRSVGLDFCTQQGTRLVSFGAPPQLVGYHHHPWPSGAVKAENDLATTVHQQQQQQQQLSCIEASSLSLHNYAAFVDPNGGNHKMFPEMVDTGGALSLLSSPPAPNAAPASSMDYAHYHQAKLDVSSSGGSTLHFPHHAPDQGSSHQTLSFMWE